ncbi:MAG: hypothetical protein K2G69_09290, partial [Muribaculaceae bacterium]|nr:hypothetical protein [Muribaculaceae bacterium]
KEMKEISLGHKPTLPEEEKTFKAISSPKITSRAIDLLFAFIQSRKEGKPLLVKAEVTTPPALMAELALLVPEEQIENLTFITNHTEEGKKKGVNIVFINEYYSFEIFRKQWVMIDLEANEAPDSAESSLFRARVEDYVKEGNLKAVHDLVGWCLSDMYEKGKAFSEETQRQLYNYLYDFDNFSLDRVAADSDLRHTLNDYFISEPAEKLRFDDKLQKRFSSNRSAEGPWEWINLVMSLNPIDCKAIIERNRPLLTGYIFSNPKNVVEFYQKYRNRFGEVQKFIQKDAFAEHEAYLSDEVMRPLWPDIYRYFLEEKLKDENKDYLVERMIHDNLDPAALQAVLNKEQIKTHEYISCLVAILAKAEKDNEKKVAKMLATAIKDRNDIVIDFFERFPDKISDPDYTPLFQWQFRTYSNLNKENLMKCADYLVKFLLNPQAKRWEQSQEGKQLFVKLYSSLKDAMKRRTITSMEVIRLCDDLRDSGYLAENVDRFDILRTIARHEDVTDMKKIDKIWEVTQEIGDRDYLKMLFPLRFTTREGQSDDEIGKFIGFALDNELKSVRELWEMAAKSPRRDSFRLSTLRHSRMKPQPALEFLTNEAGMTDEEAMEYLKVNFPKTHAEIEKSRQPSMMQKIAGFFRNMMASKKKDEAGDSEE